MLSRYKPMSLNNFFDGFFDSWLYPTLSEGIEHKKSEDGTYSTTVELPGVSESDVSVEAMPEGYIVVKGEKKTKTSSYSVTKSFTVPKDCNLEEVKANLKNGVLTLTMPCKVLPVALESKKIPVSVG